MIALLLRHRCFALQCPINTKRAVEELWYCGRVARKALIEAHAMNWQIRFSNWFVGRNDSDLRMLESYPKASKISYAAAACRTCRPAGSRRNRRARSGSIWSTPAYCVGGLCAQPAEETRPLATLGRARL